MLEKLKNIITRAETKIIGISLLITTCISLLFGLSWYLINHHFWPGFIIGFCVQIIIFAIVNTFLARKDAIVTSKLFTQQLEALSKFSISLSCAYCKQPTTVPIRLDQENRFKCENCKQVSGVKMQFISAQITTPLTKMVLPIEESDPIASTLD